MRTGMTSGGVVPPTMFGLRGDLDSSREAYSAILLPKEGARKIDDQKATYM